jgi:cytochrome d ubiquinol oxidase subunit I
MSDLLAARAQMAMSLGFHIIFAAIGIAMPLLMVIAEWCWQKTGDPVYLNLAQRWAKGTAILFAVGAVSGTVLSFELGLLWPHFMGWAGAIVGMPFSLEGFAFFLEAIFLGIYLYGWNRVSPKAHLFAGVIVAISGAASGVFVVIANSWMNTPTGFQIINGQVANVDPIAAMLNPAAFSECLHMLLAAYAATGFAVAGIHAFFLLRYPSEQFHRAALAIALTVGGATAIAQPLSGDLIARAVAHHQPAKLAAFEAHYQTQSGAPFKIIGPLQIPNGLSFLIYHRMDATVIGLDDFPPADRPPVTPVRISFQVMVAAGSAMAIVGIYWFWLRWKKREFAASKWFLRTVLVSAPMGFLAIEAGWIVTEVGRQPWIIYGFMRTQDAVTPMPGLIVPFLTFTTLYIFLAFIVAWMLIRHVSDVPVDSTLSTNDDVSPA